MASVAAPDTLAAHMQSKSNAVLETKRDLKVLQTGRPVAGYENTADLIEAHGKVTGGRPYFRFPPEPNGFLHIGHAKSMNLNFGSAQAHDGKCYLRFDDTNPEAEEQIYIDAIIEMVHWMGWRPDSITFSSDYFDQLYQFAIDLIQKGKAYVDHSSPDELKRQRELREDSPWRNRGVEENLRLFDHMRQGRYAEGEATLRVKADMKSDNPNMRDFIAYRVKYVAHPHVKDVWCIYPSYDYTHCLIDSLEHVDYSLCTLEFETRRESYFWLLSELNLWRPYVWEFSRLNVTGALLSKRKINALVKKGTVRGFDDPRLLTLAGLRRRGYTPTAINNFCDLVGITRSMNVIQLAMLENTLREDLDERCARRQVILDPIEVVIDNWDESIHDTPAESTHDGDTSSGNRNRGNGGDDADNTINHVRLVSCANHPRNPGMGVRNVKFTRTFYIDRSDFQCEDSNPKFYGLTPGPRHVGLKYSGTVTCSGFDSDELGRPVRVHVKIDFTRANKPKTNITWVSAEYNTPVELRLYSALLKDDRAAIDPEFMKYINETSEVVQRGYAEECVSELSVFESIQAERFGYFVLDQDSRAGHVVMNRVLGLREDKDKSSMAQHAPGGRTSKAKAVAKA